MSLLKNETKDYKKIYAIHFSTGYWLLLLAAWSIRVQKRRDPGSTFFRALRPTSSLKSNPPCAPSSSTSGVHKTSQAFLTALGSDGGTRCTQFRTSHTGEKTQKVRWTDHAKSPATAFCQRIPKDLLQRCFSGWSPEISYNISDRFIKRGGHKKGRGR